MLAMGPRDLNSAPYSPVHCSSHSMTSFQSSELTELPVVENGQLFAQRVHSARYAPCVSHLCQSSVVVPVTLPRECMTKCTTGIMDGNYYLWRAFYDTSYSGITPGRKPGTSSCREETQRKLVLCDVRAMPQDWYLSERMVPHHLKVGEFFLKPPFTTFAQIQYSTVQP